MASWKFCFLMVGSYVLASCAQAPVVDAEVKSEPAVQNYADDFVEVWDSSKDLPLAERRALFQQNITPLFPEFYGADRFAAPEYGVNSAEVRQAFVNKRIEREIESFADIREGYTAKVAAFSDALDQNLHLFIRKFPDFDVENEIILLHSLGEMDGGTRIFDGKKYLIFGADGMTRFHTFEDETAFFQHELFHLYHARPFDNCQKIWCDIWTEGLATLVSQQLSPTANDDELLLNFPSGVMQAVEQRLPESLLHLRDVMDIEDPKVYGALLQTDEDDTGLPPRRGYYLGYLLAKNLANDYSIHSLAKLSPHEVEALLKTSLDQLIIVCSENHDTGHPSCSK